MAKQSGYCDVSALVNLVAVIIALAAFGATCWLAAWRCEARWSPAGFATKWGPIQGCLVRAGGRWVPQSAVRVEDAQPAPSPGGAELIPGVTP